jgi:hypothetical protein
MDIAVSIHGVPIRMTEERWAHISKGHPEIAPFYDETLETIEFPDFVHQGTNNELLAVKSFKDRFEISIVVVYKETSNVDGFVITAYISNRKLNRAIIWQSQK